jgi:hypothetical protein
VLIARLKSVIDVMNVGPPEKDSSVRFAAMAQATTMIIKTAQITTHINIDS